MTITSALKNKIVVLVACCLCIMGGLALAGQLDPVYAGSHGGEQEDRDVGSISVNNGKTKYYDNVDDLLDHLEE